MMGRCLYFCIRLLCLIFDKKVLFRPLALYLPTSMLLWTRLHLSLSICIETILLISSVLEELRCMLMFRAVV